MNVPSYDALFTSRDRLVKTVMELCEGSNNIPSKNLDVAFEATSTGDVYVMGVGGYDGTNAGEAGVKTLQEVLSDLAG